MHLSSVDLAGAVGADHGDHLAVVDRKRDAEQRLEIAVEGVERADVEQRRQASAGRSPYRFRAPAGCRITVVRVALGDELAAVQHDQAVDHREQRVHDCSIQTIDTPVARTSLISSTSAAAFVLGQAAGDLVEQQHPRARSPARGRAPAACGRAA